MLRHRVEILVIGSGFAGSLMAMIARRLGFSTALLERGRHPRFAIGESSTPLANLLLEEIADDYELPGVRPFSKWGTWQKHAPQVACGLKRGFTFYHHELGRSFKSDSRRQRQLLVGASPRDEIADTHWYRPDFDHYLGRQAEDMGAAYWDETELTKAVEEPDGVRLTGKRRDEPIEFTQEFWDDRYRSAGQLWSGQPNPVFAEQVADLPPGEALEAGCGEGADAIWLARRGWTVTAVDVSAVALERGANAARAADGAAGGEIARRITWQREDLRAKCRPGELLEDPEQPQT